jgi:hypothetical protein
MTKLNLLGATALIVVLASPVMAQGTPRDQTQKQTRITPHRVHQRHMAYRQGNMTRDNVAYRNDHNGRNSGFWPGDVAAGAVATADAAVDTAGAIATAPFRGDPYAYYNNNGYNTDRNRTYYRDANAYAQARVPDETQNLYAQNHDTYVKSLRASGYNPANDRDAAGHMKTH